MGPVIDDEAADQVTAAQKELIQAGGQALTLSKSTGTRRAMLTPGIIDVTAIANRNDREIFGPLLQIIQVDDLPQAIHQANRTQYGLVAGLLSDRQEEYNFFYSRIRAGLVNWNRPTTGASSLLPFGGVGLSGNHRPTGYFAADYCSYPVACLESQVVSLPEKLAPGVEL